MKQSNQSGSWSSECFWSVVDGQAIVKHYQGKLKIEWSIICGLAFFSKSIDTSQHATADSVLSALFDPRIEDQETGE